MSHIITDDDLFLEVDKLSYTANLFTIRGEDMPSPAEKINFEPLINRSDFETELQWIRAVGDSMDEEPGDESPTHPLQPGISVTNILAYPNGAYQR